jgi:hypothetical protein
MEISIRRNHLIQPTGVSTFAIHKPPHRPKIAKELPPLPPEGILFFKIPSL